MAVSESLLKRKSPAILCYGSSSTWGYDPSSGKRFGENTRWPCVMSSSSGNSLDIIEEGLNGRTVLDHIPGKNPANGIQYLEDLLDRVDFDFIIIYLGINDLFADREVSVRHIAGGIEKMVHRIRLKKPHSATVIISPPRINGDFEAAYLYQSEIEKSAEFASKLKHKAASNGCFFVNADKIISNSSIDGIHPEGSEHIKLGRYMADFIRMSM